MEIKRSINSDAKRKKKGRKRRGNVPNIFSS